MKRKFLIFSLLGVVAVGERLWFDLGPNVELVTLTAVIASMYLGRKWGGILGVLVLLLTDMVIGNTKILLFTWSGFFMIGWGGSVLKKWQGSRRILAGGLYGAAAALGFYLWTNFGVWLLSGMYEFTLGGLMRSYMMGLPFLRLHFVSNGLILGGAMLIRELIVLTRWKREDNLGKLTI